MPSVGPLELAIVLAIALIVFGPKKLPELGRSLGHGIREFQGSVRAVRGQHEDDDGGDGSRAALESSARASKPVEGEAADQRSP